MPILTASELLQISANKYTPGSYTPLELLGYKYIYDPCLSLIPLWMAPNLITMLGLIIISVPALLVISTYSSDIHPCLFWLLAVSILVWQILDAVDGRQARRTGSSSPLGQLFDHGCDCLIFALLSAAIAVSLKLEDTLGLALIMSSQMVNFFTVWCEHYTGTHHTNLAGFFGLIEIQLSLSTIFGLLGFFGQSFLETPVPGGFQQLKYKLIILSMLFMSSLLFIVNSLSKTLLAAYKAGRLWTALTQLVPFTMLTVSAFAFRHVNQIWALGIFGLAGVKCTVGMILSTVSGRKFPSFFASHAPLFALAGLEWFGVLSDTELNFACAFVFVVVAVGLFGFCVRVTLEISAHLGIQVFTIKPKTA